MNLRNGFSVQSVAISSWNWINSWTFFWAFIGRARIWMRSLPTEMTGQTTINTKFSWEKILFFGQYRKNSRPATQHTLKDLSWTWKLEVVVIFHLIKWIYRPFKWHFRLNVGIKLRFPFYVNFQRLCVVHKLISTSTSINIWARKKKFNDIVVRA